MDGYDVETGKLVAAELGVEPCFVVVPFDEVIAGSWGDRFDVAWGSGAMTTKRMEKLYVTQPYYTTPANFFVKNGLDIQDPADLVREADRGVLRVHPRAVPAPDACAARRDPRRTPSRIRRSSRTRLSRRASTRSSPGRSTRSCAPSRSGRGDREGWRRSRMLDTPAFFTYKTGYVDRGMTLAPGRSWSDRRRHPRPRRRRQAQGRFHQVLRDGLRHRGGRVRPGRGRASTCSSSGAEPMSTTAASPGPGAGACAPASSRTSSCCRPSPCSSSARSSTSGRPAI